MDPQVWKERCNFPPWSRTCESKRVWSRGLFRTIQASDTICTRTVALTINNCSKETRLQSYAHTYKGPSDYTTSLHRSTPSRQSASSAVATKKMSLLRGSARLPRRLLSSSTCSKRPLNQPVGGRSSGAASSIVRGHTASPACKPHQHARQLT